MQLVSTVFGTGMAQSVAIENPRGWRIAKEKASKKIDSITGEKAIRDDRRPDTYESAECRCDCLYKFFLPSTRRPKNKPQHDNSGDHDKDPDIVGLPRGKGRHSPGGTKKATRRRSHRRPEWLKPAGARLPLQILSSKQSSTDDDRQISGATTA